MSEAPPGQPRFAVSREFWSGKRVFLTGNTGFKGSWLAVWLSELGAHIGGYALPPSTIPNMFDALRLEELGKHVTADIRDERALRVALRDFQPEVVIHLAAQPLVRASYVRPLETFHTNVQGTANLLDACREVDGLRAVVVVTTDKCYQNREWLWAYREEDRLGGHDPYSASKACAELVTASYRNSFFSSGIPAVASARAGNVLGGGDWSDDRLIPDAVRALVRGAPWIVRNPSSIRPWQHVIEPLAGYLMLARALYEKGREFATAFNFGPSGHHGASVREIADTFCRYWGAGAAWVHREQSEEPHEAATLTLDSSKARVSLGWSLGIDLDSTLQNTAEWYRTFYTNPGPHEMLKLTRMQISSLGESRLPSPTEAP